MREFLSILPRPSRYIGIEEGAVHKNAKDQEFHMALAFPDTYELGMSYLGQKILYAIINEKPHWWAERVMAPCRETAEILRKNNAPLCTLESDTPLNELHAIGFSITHELAYTNVLYMLDLAQIPLRSNQRGDDLFTYPIIIIGGGATLSAEPLAPFVDIMVLGEGEETLVEIAENLIKAREEKISRSQFLENLRHVNGVYIPSLFIEDKDGTLKPKFADYTKATRRIVTDLNAADYPVKQAVPIGAIHNRLALEIARGCTRGCRFCHAGMVYRPVRERSLNNLQSLLEKCLNDTGFDEVSYLSLSTGDFSGLKHLFMSTMDRCAKEQISVSLPSLRVGSIDDSIMKRVAGIRRTGATLAPEAGSQRLRDVINKGVTEEELILHIQKLIEHGWQQVKLYFMIGLPTETYADLDAIIDICCKVRDAAGRGAPRLQVTAAISPFVPKPFTPFQWEAQLTLDEMRERIEYLRAAFKAQKCLKMRWHEPQMSHLEGILSRGDRRLANVVEKAYEKGGIFASWIEGFDLTPWYEALEECALTTGEYTNERNIDAPLAWDHLEAGVDTAYLLREREKALKEKTTPDCRYAACQVCGVCDTKNQDSRLIKNNNNDNILNILNFAERDQEAHTAKYDEFGKLLRPAPSTGKAKPPAIAQELTVKAVEYRIWHTREGRAVFLSQLELQAILERCLRRAKIPMTFSQGFHPLPLLSFGRALPVGVGSKAEWFAITLREFLSPQKLKQYLNGHLPQGMDIIDIQHTIKSERTAQATSEKFCLYYQGPTEHKAQFIDAWQDFAKKQSFEWTRETKKGPKTQDLRALVSHIDIGEQSISFTSDWEKGYISPLTLSRAILGDMCLSHIYLEKMAQTFNNELTYPSTVK